RRHTRFASDWSSDVCSSDLISRGARYILEEVGGVLPDLKLDKSDGKRRLYMIGNDAIALGAIAAGCRLMFAYPITPSSEIMEQTIGRASWRGNRIRYEDTRR